MLETLQGIEQKSNFRNQHRLPRMSDIEVPTLFLTAKYMGIDSEYRLFRMLPDYLRLSVASTTAVTEPYPPPFVRSSQTYGLKHLLGSRLSDCRQYAAGSMQDQS